MCTVKTPDDGQRNCPKHIKFYSKNKFEKLVHLVGFIIRNDSELFSSVLVYLVTALSAWIFLAYFGRVNGNKLIGKYTEKRAVF